MNKVAHLPQGFQVIEAPSGLGPTGTERLSAPDGFPLALPEVSVTGFDDEGLYNLAASMITQSLLELLHRNDEVRKRALAWFLDPETRPPSEIGPMTFGWICEVTGTEPSYLLRKLRTEVVERAEHRARRGKVSLATYMERLQPFLHPVNGNGGHS